MCGCGCAGDPVDGAAVRDELAALASHVRRCARTHPGHAHVLGLHPRLLQAVPGAELGGVPMATC